MADQETPNDYALLTALLTEALPLVRMSASRGEVPNGSLSASMVAIRALGFLCTRIIEADEAAMAETLAALGNAIPDHAGSSGNVGD